MVNETATDLNGRDVVPLTPGQAALRDELVRVLRAAWPASATVDQALDRANQSYREVAQVLVALRHEFTTSDGQPDLKGRSHGYRTTVRQAYISVGSEGHGPIQKRLTAGASYWVRRLLIERYGEGHLRTMGILPRVGETTSRYSRVMKHLPADPSECLSVLVGILNTLAADPKVVLTEDVLRAAVRAVSLLKSRALAYVSHVA